MTKETKKIAVTGGGGQISYNLLFRIAHGDLLGFDQPISLHIHDLPEQCDSVLKGVVMELEDGNYPLLHEVVYSSDLYKVFDRVNYAILIGSKPRGPGMERKDLLLENGGIFQKQGKVLNEVAAKDVLVFVVGNPCNTNCLIAMSNAPAIAKENFHAMTRLDQNRAFFQVAKKAGVKLSDIENITIWGNHSSTQVPDFLNAKILDRPLIDIVKDKQWLENEFYKIIQQRGAEIIKVRGKSSAASASQAVIDAIKDLTTPTKKGKWFSSAISSDKNPYGIKEGLIFSFPCICNRKKEIKIVDNLIIDEFMKEKIKLTEKELLEEREVVKHLL